MLIFLFSQSKTADRASLVRENKWQYTALKKSVETAERSRSSWVRMLNSLACSAESRAGNSRQVRSLVQ